MHKPERATDFLKATGLSAWDVPTVTKPHGDFDSVEREQDYSVLHRPADSECVQWRGKEPKPRRGEEWTPCMCGKWFWQGSKLMISTCARVEDHQKEKCRQKRYSHAGATDGETTRTTTQKPWRTLAVGRKKNHVLLTQNVNFNAVKSWYPVGASSHEGIWQSGYLTEVWGSFKSPRRANQTVHLAAC